MGLPSLNQILSNLGNTVGGVLGVEPVADPNAATVTPAEPLIDLGLNLGSGTSTIGVGATVLDPNSGLLLDLDLDLGAGTGTAAPGLDLGSVVDLLTGTTTAPSAGAPALPALGDLLDNVVETVGLDNILDINLGTGTLVVDPTAGTVPGTGSPTDPSTTDPEPANVTELVNEVIEAVGLDDLLGIDVNLGVGTGGSGTPVIDIDASVGVGGGSTTPSTSVPGTGTGGAGGGTGTSGGGVNVGVDVSTGSSGATGSTGGGTNTGGGGHGGTVIHVGHGSGVGVGTSQVLELDQRHWMDGGSGNDTILASNGSDTVFGHDGNDAIFANQSADRIFGGQGDDYMRGGRGDDMVSGGDGDDDIWGDLGDDVLEGEDGADVFYFALNSGHDVILDFNYAQGDRLDFNGQDYSVTEADGSAIITLSGGGQISLNGVSAAQFELTGFA